MQPFKANSIRIYLPHKKIESATLISLIGYNYTRVRTTGKYGYCRYFRQRWQEAQSFINVEHDSVLWAGAIESLQNCQEDWCAFDSSLPCLRDRDMHHETTFVPIACTKFSSNFILQTQNMWDELIHWEVCDGQITKVAKQTGFRVHQHWPSIVNANKVLLGLVHEES